MSNLAQDAAKALYSGQVVAHPTETCYGLAVDIFQKSAIERLYSLKKMSLSKPVSILVRDLDEAQRYGEFNSSALKLALKNWPGPLTIIVPKKKTLPAWINPGMDSVGVRVSSNRKTRELVEAFGSPISTTSANIAGEACCYSVDEFLQQGLKPDFVLDSGRIAENLPSTIVKVGEALEIVRQGSLKIV
jgi:L-threonylcarbamoyladenylate synthase